jgi:hypothetical protein
MLEILSLIVSGIEKFISNRQEMAIEKQKTAVAIEQNKQRLALDEETHNHEWEMASLANSDNFIRRASFFMFSAPFAIAIFAPESIHIYFSHSIATIPPFWQHTWVAINGSIWGISSLKNSIPAVFNALRMRS